MVNSILDVVKKGLCTGCGTCYSLCPNESIEVGIDQKKGIYIPQINQECNNCGICLKVCPGYEFDFKKFNKELFGKPPDENLLGNVHECHLGYSNDNDIRCRSSSGGLVTQILISALEMGLIDGALVTRMKKNNPFKPEPFIAESKDEIIEASTSKYCPVPANIALKKILESKNKKFAVVGLPCHIHGIRKAEIINKELKEKIVLHIGIFCSTVPNFLATKFLLHKYDIDQEKVESMSYRGDGWPGFLKFKLEKNEISIPMHEYRSSGFAEYFIPMRCKLCIDMCNEFADLSIGDAWLPEIVKTDETGTSILLIRNDVSNKIFNEIKHINSIYTVKMKLENVIKSQNYLKTKKSHYKVFSFLNRSEPYYNTKSIKPQLIYYLNIIPFVIMKTLSSHTYLWNLLISYKSVKMIIYSGHITNLLKRIKLIR